MCVFLRNLFQPEVLKDVDQCGIPGTEELDATSKKVSDEVRVEECLWDCQWQPNPCYKNVLKWITKLNERVNTEDNAHLLLFTSPQVPRDLSCLEDCFIRFEAGSDWAKRSKVRRKCSANGLDRLIPTHTKEGQDFIKSNYSDAFLFWKNANDFASINPNLDCLQWKGKQFRQKSEETSNFIAQPFLEEEPRNTTRTKLKRKKYSKKHKNSKRGRNHKRKKTKRKTLRYSRQAVDVDEEWYWQGTRQFLTNVEAVHRDEDEDEADDTWQRFMFRAPNPVAKAVEICSLAKYVQIFNAYPKLKTAKISTHTCLPPTTVSSASSLFSSGPQVCDNFLPDLFKQICRCVGRCKNIDKNKIRHFFTEEGLWGCQNACRNEKGCEFYTLSRPNPDYILDVGAPDVNRCTLWRHCDAFEIPEASTTRGSSVSDHWSGAAMCQKWKQKCPKLTGTSYDEVSAFSLRLI